MVNILRINLISYSGIRISGRDSRFFILDMVVSEFNEDTHDQICDLLESLQQAEKLKNKDMRILLDKVVRKYGGKVVNK